MLQMGLTTRTGDDELLEAAEPRHEVVPDRRRSQGETTQKLYQRIS